MWTWPLIDWVIEIIVFGFQKTKILVLLFVFVFFLNNRNRVEKMTITNLWSDDVGVIKDKKNHNFLIKLSAK